MSRGKFATSLLIFSSLLTTACSRHDSDEKFFLVSANVQLPYWQEAKAGFMHASDQLRVQAKFVGDFSSVHGIL